MQFNYRRTWAKRVYTLELGVCALPIITLYISEVIRVGSPPSSILQFCSILIYVS